MRCILVFLLLLPMLACEPIEQQARDTAAGLEGALTAAQAKYQPSCSKNPNQNACQIINQAIAGQNALVTAIEAYCGWSAAMPPQNQTSTCLPVKTAQAGLATAISNANLFITELKGILK